jgi:hypothetical protein
MTTTEHLAKVRAKCVELLEISSRRTQGKWWSFDADCAPEVVISNSSPVASCTVFGNGIPSLNQRLENARFIAACAGPAEAGWRSTIAAIDATRDMGELESDILSANILAAWPEDCL